MLGTQPARWVARGIAAVAALLYLGSFFLPDRRSHWTGGGPGAPGVAEEAYILAEMACSPPRAWTDAIAASDGWAFACALAGWPNAGWWRGPPLDLSGWCGHAAAAVGLGLLATGRGRGAVAAAVIGLGHGLARHGVLERNEQFAAGYYAWLASMAALGIAGAVRWRAGARERNAEPAAAPARGG